MSDESDLAIVVIALVGNPVSPAYWWRRRRGATDPLRYSAMNVAIYGRGTSAFSLYERPITTSDRSKNGVGIGRSSMSWQGDDLVIDLEERTTPLGFPIRGRIVVRPEVAPATVVQLDPGRLHRWWPVAPLCRIEVELAQPSLRFRGHGYHDANAGSVPLEATFSEWTWSRARAGESALLTYDVQLGSGVSLGHAYRIGRRGDLEVIDGLEKVDLGRSFWGLRRSASADLGASVGMRRSLEDGPFYSRALIDSTMAGRQVVAMHEHLSGERLTKGWVRYLTRHRMRSE